MCNSEAWQRRIPIHEDTGPRKGWAGVPWCRVLGPLGRAPLRPGQRGPAVQALQERLRELGYDPGPADGVYGHQTAEAVRELQRDCRLRVDGIAGPQVLSVLRDPAVLALRRPLALAPGQSLADAARALQLSPAALRRALGLPPRAQPAPGQRWVLWERVVAAEVKPGPGQAAGLRALQRRASLVSAAAVVAAGGPGDDPAALEAAAAATALGLPVWVTLHTRRAPALLPGSYGPGQVQQLLHGGRERDRWVQRALDWSRVPGVTGVHLDLGGLRFGDGPRWLRLVRRVAAALHSASREVIVSVPLRDRRGFWARAADDVDWEAVAGLVDRVVLVPPVLAERARPRRPLAPPELAGRLRAAVRRVPPWRCLLALPVGALILPGLGEEGASPAVPGTLSAPRARSLAYRARTRPHWEEAAGRPRFQCVAEGREREVWLENRESLARKLDLVEGLRLGGVYLSAMGEEDAGVWTALRERWKVHKLPSAPGDATA